jgi:hypothetical protein
LLLLLLLLLLRLLLLVLLVVCSMSLNWRRQHWWLGWRHIYGTNSQSQQRGLRLSTCWPI